MYYLGGENMAEKEWPEEFYRYLLVERGYSEKTQEAYKEDLENFKLFFRRIRE